MMEPFTNLLNFEMDSALALILTQKLLAVSLIIQTIEFLTLGPTTSDKGVWRWSDLRDDFRFAIKPIRWLLDQTLAGSRFPLLLWLRLLTAVFLLVFPHPLFMLILLLTTVLILIRWRGSFNGGSDYMTLIVLLSLLLAEGFPQIGGVALGALWYMAIQACSSYFKAGIIKIKRPNWRQGIALKSFLQTSIYQKTNFVSWLEKSPKVLFIGSWAVMLFEVAFPLALVNNAYCTILVLTAILFQLGNIYFFGLNRFLYAWLPTYPALFYCSGTLFS